MLIHLGQRTDELTREQAGRIATSNLMDVAPSQEDQYFEIPAGIRVSIDDLWQGTKGFRSYLDQLEALAAKCGGVIEHPGDVLHPNSAGNVTPKSFFVVPTISHGGARPGAGRPALYGGSTIRFSLTLSVEQSNWLDAQGPSRADAVRRLIDEALSRETSHANLS